MLKFLPVVLLALLLFEGRDALASDQPEQDGPYRIHVITIGPGDELFARFGHIALLVENTATGRKLAYNFGMFNFDDPDLQIKYARGFLNFWLDVVDFEYFFYHYAQSNRDVWLQTLNLSDEKAKEVAKKLEINARPENRYYPYRHFLDNCCTRVRDVIDNATDGAISTRFKSKKVDRDFRYWTAQCLEGLPLYKSIILYSLGPAIDQPITRWDEEFLPVVFFEDLDKVTVGKSRVPLVARRQQLLKREGPAVGETIPTIDIVVISILILIFIAGFVAPIVAKERNWSRRLLGFGLIFWGLLAGLGSLMLILYWTVTAHFDTHYNENLLVNPVLHLWLLGPGAMLLFKAGLRPLSQKVIRWYLIASLGLVALDIVLKIGPFIQGNWGPILVATVANGAALLALKRTKAIS